MNVFKKFRLCRMAILAGAAAVVLSAGAASAQTAIKFSLDFKFEGPSAPFLIAIVWELALIVALIQVPAVRTAFGITIPSAADLGLIFVLGIGIVVVIEITKVAFRTTARGRTMTAYAGQG